MIGSRPAARPCGSDQQRQPVRNGIRGDILRQFARETKEETDFELTNIRAVCVNNAVDLPANYHYVVVFLRGEATSAPRNMVCAGVCLRVLARAFPQLLQAPLLTLPCPGTTKARRLAVGRLEVRELPVAALCRPSRYSEPRV